MSQDLKKIIAEYAHVIKNILLFQDIPTKELVKFLVAFHHSELDNGGTFFKDKDPSTNMSILLKGDADIFKGNLKICSLRAPALIGEMGLFTGMPRNATVKSFGHTLSLTITQNELNSLLQTEPQLSKKIYRNIILCLRHKINYDNQRIIHLQEENNKKEQEILQLQKGLGGTALPEKADSQILGENDLVVGKRPGHRKRRHIRVTISQPGFCHLKIANKVIVIKDISTGGVSIDLTKLPKPLESSFKEGSAIKGDIMLKDHQPYPFSGTVRNLFPNLCGVSFDPLPIRVESTIKRVVADFQKLGQVV